MADDLPEYLMQGEPARLFPVLSTTSKEGRTTSIVLACLGIIEEFGAALLATVGQRVGRRSSIVAFTEVCFKQQPSGMKERPDGLIVVKSGTREWRAIVETKVGNNDLNSDQVERYRTIAKDNKVDCVITISNQFATSPTAHPVEAIRRSRSKIPVFHWSWMRILTIVDLLINQKMVGDEDQRVLLNELRRFLSHESAGVRGFDRMPPEWTELNRLVSSGGVIGSKSQEATTVIEAWHQETRDLSLILTRLTEADVRERLPRKHLADPAQRVKDELALLREAHRLTCVLDIPGAAAPVEVVADLSRRSINVGMSLKAPADKKSTRARLNWLLRQIKVDKADDLYVRLLWPGTSEPTQFSVAELRVKPELCDEGKAHLVAHGFHVFRSKPTGSRFTQQTNFITDLEQTVPDFYGHVGSNLSAWKPPAPKIKHGREGSEDVSVEALSEQAEDFQPDSETVSGYAPQA